MRSAISVQEASKSKQRVGVASAVYLIALRASYLEQALLKPGHNDWLDHWKMERLTRTEIINLRHKHLFIKWIKSHPLQAPFLVGG
jgi:hypothetical protein